MPTTCNAYRGWRKPLWFAEPVITCPRIPGVMLSVLEPDKKRLVWEHLKTNHQSIAGLLTSPEFQQVKAGLEASFGPVKIGVDLKDIGGSLYGVRRQTKKNY